MPASKFESSAGTMVRLVSAIMGGKPAFGPLRVIVTSSGAVACTSLITATRDLDCEMLSSPRCRLIENTTSSASIVLPLWNSTPLRSLNVQTVRSSLASQLVASSGTNTPPAPISIRLLRICHWRFCMNFVSVTCGSSVSPESKLPIPIRKVPP